ncbi:MAG: hypothetical protein KME19_08890 [Microcoleus vaginatus WJT46-NPBG5]|jgi:hypothetical protein|nr:hypothetical protein [Microcoleus vaginatus WJT46-NPBG5]MBW4680216.1 hypothetical protein [Microcoleus vaginatus WJT46-NPBG5]
MSYKPTYPDFNQLNLKQLREYAKGKGVTGYSGLDLDQLWNKLWRWVLLTEGFDIRTPEETTNQL